MAKSKYEYVKAFEQCTTLLPNTYMIVRLDGRGFHKFVPDFCSTSPAKLILHTIRLAAKYRFEKPNDRNALGLMNAAATAVMKELPDIKCAYGISDEYRYYTGS